MMIRSDLAVSTAKTISHNDAANIYRALGDVLVAAQHEVVEKLAHWSARQAAAPSVAGAKLLHRLTITLDGLAAQERWLAQCAGRATLSAEREAEWPLSPQMLAVHAGPAAGALELPARVNPLHGDHSSGREVA